MNKTRSTMVAISGDHRKGYAECTDPVEKSLTTFSSVDVCSVAWLSRVDTCVGPFC